MTHNTVSTGSKLVGNEFKEPLSNKIKLLKKT